MSASIIVDMHQSYPQLGTFCYQKCCKWHYFTLFNSWVTFICIYVPHLLHSFFYQWAFRLLPCLRYCKQCCIEHWGSCIHEPFIHVSIFWTMVFFEYITRSGIAGWYGSSILCSIVAASIYIPTNNVRGFLFSWSLYCIYCL